MEILNFLADAVFGHADVTIALAAGATAFGVIEEGILATARRWHGGIDDKFDCIDNLIRAVNAHPTWALPTQLKADLLGGHNELRERIAKCHGLEASTTTRQLRDSLLKHMIDLCLVKTRMWAYGQYATGALTADDIHLMGFLLPGEGGRHYDRGEATNITPEVKVRVIDGSFIRVVIDQAANENAAEVVHGWPNGIRNALIVIMAADGVTEVYRQLTTHLHTNVRMPDGSRGKQFMIKAAFLAHVDDEPRFGNEPTFSMPLTTEDLTATLNRQHKEDIEAHLQEEARLRHEIEQMQAAAEAKK